MATETFTYTGSQQTFDVPSGVSQVTIRCYGAGGGAGHNFNAADEPGGTGGYGETTISVSGGETLYVYVGEQGVSATSSSRGAGGWNGGAAGGGNGNAHGGGGGGASDVRQGGTSLSDRVAVGGGGGGGGGAFGSDNSTGGGNGGGSSGSDGQEDSFEFEYGSAGSGGTQSSGGSGGSAGDAGSNGGSGSFGSGGGGGGGDTYTGGGGGGGYYGGGGGGSGGNTAGGGGGGSGFGDTLNRGGGNSGDGLVKIEYTSAPASPNNADIDIEDDDTGTSTWDADNSAGSPSGYDVDIQTDGGGWIRVADLGSGARSHTETLARATDTVRFRVRAVNSAGASDWSYTSTESTNVSGLQITGTTATSIDLSWSDPSANDGTDVLIAEATGSTAADYSVDKSVGASASAATISGLENGERYYIRVQATYSGADGTPSPVSNEVDTTLAVPAPSIDSLDASTQREITVAYSLADNSTDGDLLVERSTDSGSTWTDAGTVSNLSATEFVDTGRDDGTEYTYRVTRRTDHTEATSGTASATTVAPAPTLDSLIVDGDVLDVTGTDNGNAELRHEIEIQRTNTTGSTWAQSGADIAAETGDGNTIAGSTAALLDGERYDARLRTVYPDASATSNVLSETTVLGDEDQPVLGNGVEDEIAVDRENAVSDYGSVRIEYRETGASSWIDWGVVAFDRLDPVIAGLEDGEEYEIRARTETEHVVGAWTEPVAIITKFPGATDLQVTSTTPTSVSGEVTDNADNEDGFELERREQFRDGYGAWQTVETLGPNSGTGTVTWTDDNAQPNTTYQYRIRAFTEHSSATTPAVETTTNDDGVRTDRVPAEGWHVVVEDTLGNSYTPTIVDEPTYRPALNGLPTVEIPVPNAGRWEDTEAWERQPMRVYLDGDRKPIERLERPRTEADRAVLVGKGGVEIEELVEEDVVEEDAHLVAQNIIQTTPYAAHVDDPDSATAADTLLESVDDESAWDGAVGDPPADALWETDGNGRLRTRQSGHFVEAENADITRISNTVQDFGDTSLYSGDAVEVVSDPEANGTWAEIAHGWETDHQIPDGQWTVAAHIRVPNTGNHGFQFFVDDGTTRETFDPLPADALADQESDASWQVANTPTLGALDAGNLTAGIEFTEYSANDGTVHVDCIALYDTRVDPGLGEQVVDNTVAMDLHPQAVDVETGDVTTVRQVVGGGLTVEANSTANGQAIALSNDQGGTYPISASNATDIDGQFGDGSATLRARFTLSGYDASPSTSPIGRTAPTEVDSYELSADLDDTPILINRGLSGSGVEVLNTIAELDFIWEVVWDESVDGIAIEWTQPGQRTASVDPNLVDYSVETDYGSVVRKARIKGTLTPIEGEERSVSHDLFVGLDEDYTEDTGEIVRSQDGSTQYERGVDYEWLPNEGAIKALSTGAIADGETVVVDYRYHIVGEYEAPDYTGDTRVFEETLPNVTTRRSAEQAALIAVKSASKPIQTASVTVDRELDVPLVEAIDVDQLPTREPLETWSVDTSPQSVSLQLGTRDPVEETLNRLNSRLGAVSQKV